MKTAAKPYAHAPTGPSRTELLDKLATARAVAEAARREADEAERRAIEAERAAEDADAEADERVIAAESTAENAVNQLADVLVVLARWGVNIDRGHVGALTEYALRAAAAGPCQASCRTARWAA